MMHTEFDTLMQTEQAVSYIPRVLIVEDETLIAEELKDRLEGFGFLVIAIVDTAEQGVRIATAELPDLVLMDIRLKGKKDGVQASIEIRRQVDIPVIYLTAYSDRATLDRAKNTNPYGYILKPFHERELQVAIELAMHRHSLERQAQQRRQ
jgi:DNA-binding response OmpR family regulator